MPVKVLILGGGAAGMTAAISASEHGAEVTILERSDRVGRKLLSTGNGKCNFTNTILDDTCYHSDNNGFQENALARFGREELIFWFEKMGIPYRVKNGGYYPMSEQAQAVQDTLRMELAEHKVNVITDASVTKIAKKGSAFVVSYIKDGKEIRLSSDRVILASGSKAAPKIGGDGSGYKLAKELGHSIVPVVPALVQIRCMETCDFKQVQGVRVQGSVTAFCENERWADRGELQLTDYGISGIPVFQISGRVARALYEKKSVKLELDLFPDFSEEALISYLNERFERHIGRTNEEFLTGLINKKLVILVLKKAGASPSKPCQKGDPLRIARILKHLTYTPLAVNGFDQAQICAGGINTKEIDPNTLESRLVPGLYIAGEIMDVDGICGGYNLQWAFTTGRITGEEAASC